MDLATAPNGVTLLWGSTLEGDGVVHAFITRIGGESQGPFATLNLGHGVDALVEADCVPILLSSPIAATGSPGAWAR